MKRITPLSSRCWPLSSAAAPFVWPELCYWSSAFSTTSQFLDSCAQTCEKETKYTHIRVLTEMSLVFATRSYIPPVLRTPYFFNQLIRFWWPKVRVTLTSHSWKCDLKNSLTGIWLVRGWTDRISVVKGQGDCDIMQVLFSSVLHLRRREFHYIWHKSPLGVMRNVCTDTRVNNVTDSNCGKSSILWIKGHLGPCTNKMYKVKKEEDASAVAALSWMHKQLSNSRTQSY